LPHNLPTNDLWRRLTEHNDPAARAELVERNRPLVAYLANRLFQQPPPGLSWDDLEGIGMVGLVRAVDRFDPARQVKFGTFAARCILNQLKRAAATAQRRAAPELPRDVSEQLEDQGPQPEALALAGALGERLWPLVESLPDPVAYVLRRRYRDGAEMAEIAREWGWHVSWAYKVHREGLDRLRVLLEGDEILEKV
jgi:RNA polymerase sigma factor (sigma-70 family)